MLNLSCCVLLKNETIATSSDSKTTKTVSEGNNDTITVFNKCCEDYEAFDVVSKKCIPVKNYGNETTDFPKNRIYLGN